jgi:hypothetical protein
LATVYAKNIRSQVILMQGVTMVHADLAENARHFDWFGTGGG